MSGPISTLLYLDGHLVMNRVLAVVRTPRRLLPWSVFLVWLIAMLPVRLRAGRGSAPELLPDVAHALAAIVPGLALAFAAFLLRRACDRAPSAFSSPADARFLCGSGLAPRLVVLWLQGRKIVALCLGYALPILMWSVVVPTVLHFTALTALLLGLAMAMLTGAALGLQLPVYLLARRHPHLRLRWVTGALVLAGIAAAGLGLLVTAGVGVPRLLRELPPQLPPGSWLVGAGRHEPASIISLAILLGLSTAATVVAGDDCYPELWESSNRRFIVRRLFRQRRPLGFLEVRRALRSAAAEGAGGDTLERRAQSSASVLVPGGAWTVLWKEWMTFRRQPNSLVLSLLVLFGAVAGGVIMGELYRRGPRGAGGALVSILAYGLFITNSVRPVRLAADLRSPLWWLSSDNLTARLAIWTLASTLRQFIPVVVAGLLAALLAGAPWLAALLAPFVFALVWDLRAISLATYSLMPSAADMRGPGAILRVFAIAALAVPVLLAVVPTLVIARSPVAAMAVALTVSLAEGWLLIRLAARRLSGNGLAFAREERA